MTAHCNTCRRQFSPEELADPVTQEICADCMVASENCGDWFGEYDKRHYS